MHMIYLHKLLPLIVSPLGFICLLLLINIKWRQVRLTIAALACLIIFSLPVTASFIWSSLEKDYPYRPVQELGIHKAVVVLGGMLGGFEDLPPTPRMLEHVRLGQESECHCIPPMSRLFQ